MTRIATPLIATGWENTLVNDSEGNTLCLMPNGHKGLEAVQELTALWAAAPDLLAACEALAQSVAYAADALDAPANSTMRANLADALAAIAKAKGE